MNRFGMVTLFTAGVAVAISIPNIGFAQGTYTGTVERVWEDGFRLDTGDRTIRVDSWDVYGDNTPNHVAVGDQITVTGEFERGEFDAFSINDATTPNLHTASSGS